MKKVNWQRIALVVCCGLILIMVLLHVVPIPIGGPGNKTQPATQQRIVVEGIEITFKDEVKFEVSHLNAEVEIKFLNGPVSFHARRLDGGLAFLLIRGPQGHHLVNNEVIEEDAEVIRIPVKK